MQGGAPHTATVRRVVKSMSCVFLGRQRQASRPFGHIAGEGMKPDTFPSLRQAGRGKAGVARQGMAWRGKAGTAWRGKAGTAGRGKAGEARRGVARRGMAGQGVAINFEGERRWLK